MFRFRLINAGCDDLGPFASAVPTWRPGDRIQRGAGDTLVVAQVVAAEESDDFNAYLVVEAAA